MPSIKNPPYQVKSPVLFVIFNRPQFAQKVFAQIKEAKPKRLYIAADGPRSDFPDDKSLCMQARDIVSVNNIDWECEVKTLFRDENVGCKGGVSSAADWFFSLEDEGIILEDDCLPANSFFKFCDVMLEKYRNDTRIRHITGCNLQHGKKWGSGSYYFSNMTHVWGWASWQRAWKAYDRTLGKYSETDAKALLSTIFEDRLIVDSWVNIFNEVKAGKIDAWGYQLDFANYFNNGLTIIPNQNLISNIGFGANATHTLDAQSLYANIPLTEMMEIVDPLSISPEKQADLIVLTRDFNIEEKLRRENSLGRRVKKWLTGRRN